MKPFTKADIIKEISARTGFAQEDVQTVFDLTFLIITEALVRGDHVLITNFGKFVMVKKEPRPCLDPRTSKPIMSNFKASIKFIQSRNKETPLSNLMNPIYDWSEFD